jgi:hypothetical protein
MQGVQGFLESKAECFSQEVQCLYKDGSRIWVRLTIVLCAPDDMPG